MTAAFALVVAVGLFNAIVDPFGTVNWVRAPGFNAVKTARYNHARLFAALDVQRVRPQTVVLGTSASHLGIRMSHPGWQGEPRYNLAIEGGVPEELYAYLQHAHALGPLKQVVLGLDSWQMTGYGMPTKPDFDTSLLTRPGDPWGWIRPYLVELRVLLSFDTLFESIATLQQQDYSDWIAPDGQRLGQVQFRTPGHEFTRDRPREYFLAYDRFQIGLKFPSGQRPPDSSVPDVSPPVTVDIGNMSSFEPIRAIVRFCRENNIDLRIYISPGHAHEKQVAAAIHEWSAVENGKRALVQFLAEDAKLHGTRLVPLWDFSLYSSVTTENVPPPGDRSEMRYYWDPSHFKEEVGDWILDRVFGTHRESNKIPDDFGRELTMDTIETVLAEMRQGHAHYVKTHPQDEAFLRRTIAERRGQVTLRSAASD